MNSSKKIMNQQNESKEVKKESSAAVPAKKIRKTSFLAGRDLKPIILTVLCVVVVLVLCIGVGIQQFKPKVVVKVGDTKITMNDMMYPIYEVESTYLPYNEMYETYTGKSIWESDYQGSSGSKASGITNSIGLKQEILNSEVQYEILYQKAVKAKYKLSSDEKKDAEKKAEDALKGLSWLQKVQLNISKSNLTDRFEKRALANKFKEDQQKTLNKDVDEKAAIKDIKKADYREYDIQYYYGALTKKDSNGKSTALSDKEKSELKTQMQEIAAKAKAGNDFTDLKTSDMKNVTFEKNGKFTEKDGWSYVSDKNLKKIKKMNNDDVSEAIIDENYYVVVKMVDNNSNNAYKEACDSAIKTAQDSAYQTWYDKEEQKYKIDVNTDVWTDVTIGTVTTDIVTAEDLQNMKEDSSDAAKSSSEK